MPVVLIDGVHTTVTAADARRGLSDGSYQWVPGRTMRVVNNGVVGTIDVSNAADVAAVLGGGEDIRLAEDTEVHEARMESEFGEGATTGTLAAGFGRSVASGLTFGATDSNAYNGRAPDPDAGRDVLEFRERNEGLNLGGQVLGAVGGALLTGGATGGLNLGARALAGGGTAVVRGGAGRLAQQALFRGLGGAGRGTVGRAATNAAATGALGAAEGALQGAGHAFGDAALANRELTGEALASQTLTGALFGGVTGGALGGGASLAGDGARALMRGGTRAWRGTRDAVGRLWERANPGTTARPGVIDAVLERYARTAGSTLDADSRSFLQRAVRLDGEGRRVRDIVGRGEAAYDVMIPRLRSHLDEMSEVTDAVMEHGRGALKRDQVARIIRGDAGAAAEQAQPLLLQLRSVADGFDEARGAFPGSGGVIRQLRQIEETFNERLTTQAFANGDRTALIDVFMVMEEAKQVLGQLTKRANNSPSLAMIRTQMDDLYEGFRRHLETEDLYGPASAAQRERNSAWSRLIANSQEFDRHFRTRTGEQAGFRAMRGADPAKVAAYLRRSGTAEGALVDEVFERQITLQQELVETMSHHYDLPPQLVAAIERGRPNLGRVRGAMDDIRSEIQVLNQFRSMSAQLQQGAGMMQNAGSVAGSLAGGVAGSIAGGGVVGGFIGQAGGALIGGGIDALRRPDKLIRSMAAMERANSNILTRLSTGTRAYVARITGQARRALPSGSRPLALTSGQGRRRLPTGSVNQATSGSAAVLGIDAFHPTLERVTELAANPAAQSETIAAELDDFHRAAPEAAGQAAATASRAVGFLAARMPATARRRMHSPIPGDDSPPLVSDAEKARFMRYFAAVSDPTSVVDSLERGDLSREEVEAMREVFPEMYAQLVRGVMDALGEAGEGSVTISYQNRIELGILLGQPTHASMRGEFIAAAQATYEDTAEAPLPPSSRTPPDTAGDHQTESQRIANRRAG